MEKGKTLPSEVIAALLFLTNQRLLSADINRLYQALKVARDLSPLIKQFSISTSGIHPISRTFDRALSLLKLTRVVRMENTDYDHYIIDDQARNYINSEIIPKFEKDEIKALSRAAAIIREKCGVQEVV